MFRKIVSLMAVVLLVAACSSKPKEDVAVTSDMNAQAPVSDGIDGLDSYDASTMQGPAPGTQQDLVVNVGDRVFFDYDQYDLKAEARGTVERQAQWLKTYPSLRVTLEGHCDERGTREYNLALGEKRAMSVRNYLIALGVSADRIETVSFGKERPAVLGSSESAWAQNRRTVAVVQ